MLPGNATLSLGPEDTSVGRSGRGCRSAGRAGLQGAGESPWLPRVSPASGVQGGAGRSPTEGRIQDVAQPLSPQHTHAGAENGGREEEDVGALTLPGLRLRAQRGGPAWASRPAAPCGQGLPLGQVRGRLQTPSREAPREPRGPRSRPRGCGGKAVHLQTGCSADIAAMKYDFLYGLPGRFSRFPAAITATCARLFCRVRTCGCARVCACWSAEAWPSPGTPRSDAGLACVDGPVHGKLLEAGPAVLWAPPLAPGPAEPFPGCPQPPQPWGLPDLQPLALVSRSAAWASPGDGAPRLPPACSSSVLFLPRPGPGASPDRGCRRWASRGREDTPCFNNIRSVLPRRRVGRGALGSCQRLGSPRRSGTQGEQEAQRSRPWGRAQGVGSAGRRGVTDPRPPYLCCVFIEGKSPDRTQPLSREQLSGI